MMLNILIISMVFLPTFGIYVDEVLNSTNTQIFYELAEQAGILSTLKTDNYTVFAPSDAAFKALPESVLLELRNADAKALTKLLHYHVIPEIVLAYEMVDDMRLKSLNGKAVRINKYHSNLTLVQGKTIVDTLPEADNGIVYLVDGVLMPPQRTLMEIIGNNTEYSKFYQLMTRANLNSLLNQEDANLTVFAWPDSAWEKLQSNTQLAMGLQLRTDVITGVAKYHIVPHTLYSQGFSEGELTNLRQEDKLMIKILDTGIKVNYATVTEPDTIAINGVLHRVDKILIPPQLLKVAQRFISGDGPRNLISRLLQGNGL